MEDNGDSDGEHSSMDGDDAFGGPLVGAANDSNDDEEEHFDISLAASHSYMGPGLVPVSGRRVLEAGWTGRVPVAAHHGAVFPGETVPMLLPHAAHASDAGALTRAIRHDRLFGLLCPDETGTIVSGYGVLCEVYEAGGGGDGEAGERGGGGGGGGAGEADAAPAPAPAVLTFKARAIHRFRFVDMPKRTVPVHLFARMRFVEVRVLPEIPPASPLRPVSLASLDPHRRRDTLLDRRLRGMDAAVTGWPLFVYEIFDYARMRQLIRNYFKTLMLDRQLPEDPISLSFWVASNLALSARDRLALFVVDHALLRLHMEVRLIHTKSVLCCSSCMTEIARREHIFAMSSEGVHSNYTNLGGYMHDIVTVSSATSVSLEGEASAEYSWFPGYSWSIATCASCTAHVGWRFDALKRNLRPQQFFGICRNTVQPRHRAPSRADSL